MAYKITFEDGSSGYLSHHGVQGQKWGVWNEETRKRRLGLGSALKKTALSVGSSFKTQLEKRNETMENWYKDLFRKKTRNWTAEEDCKVINPFYKNATDELKPYIDKYGESLAGITQQESSSLAYMGAYFNCANCTVIFDLRRRGYDVDATSTEMLADMYQYGLGYLYEPPLENHDESTIEDLEKRLEELPDGARGGLSGTTLNGSGHAIAWEKDNGKVTFYDCQSGNTYDFNTLEKVYAVSHDTDSKIFDHRSLRWNRSDENVPNLEHFKNLGLVSRRTENGNPDTYLDDLETRIRGWKTKVYVEEALAKVKDPLGYDTSVDKTINDETKKTIDDIYNQERANVLRREKKS